MATYFSPNHSMAEESVEDLENSLLSLCQGSVDENKLKNMSYEGIVSDILHLCRDEIGPTAPDNVIVTVNLVSSDDESSDNESNKANINDHQANIHHHHHHSESDSEFDTPYVPERERDDSYFDNFANWLKTTYYHQTSGGTNSNENTTSNNNNNNNSISNREEMAMDIETFNDEVDTEPATPTAFEDQDDVKPTTEELLRNVNERLYENIRDGTSTDENDFVQNNQNRDNSLVNDPEVKNFASDPEESNSEETIENVRNFVENDLGGGNTIEMANNNQMTNTYIEKNQNVGSSGETAENVRNFVENQNESHLSTNNLNEKDNVEENIENISKFLQTGQDSTLNEIRVQEEENIPNWQNVKIKSEPGITQDLTLNEVRIDEEENTSNWQNLLIKPKPRTGEDFEVRIVEENIPNWQNIRLKPEPRTGEDFEVRIVEENIPNWQNLRIKPEPRSPTTVHSPSPPVDPENQEIPIYQGTFNSSLIQKEYNTIPDEINVDFEAIVDNPDIKKEANDNDGFVRLPSSFSFDGLGTSSNVEIKKELFKPEPVMWDDEDTSEMPPLSSSDDEDTARRSPSSFAPKDVQSTPPLNRPLRTDFANIFDKFPRAPASPARTELVGDDLISLFADETEMGDLLQDDDEYLGLDDDLPSTSDTSKMPAKYSMKPDFVSDDPMENKDNNNPEWRVMKLLQTDDERYKVVRLRWKNVLVPDPGINLTTHNYWKKQLEMSGRKVVVNKFGKRPASEDLQRNGNKKMRCCTDAQDSQIEKLKELWEGDRKSLKEDYRNRKRMLELELKRQRRRIQRDYFDQSQNCNNMFVLQKMLCEQKIQLQEDYNYTVAKLDEIRDQNFNFLQKRYTDSIKNIKVVRDEIFTFQKYYSNLKNSSTFNKDTTLISEERYEELMEDEQMYEQYERLYLD